MMSIRALGNLGASGADAKQAAHYYSERSADYYVKGASGDKGREHKHDESQGQHSHGDQSRASAAGVENSDRLWIGRGAEKLGLTEAPTREQLQLSLGGHLGGRQVQNAGRENRQMGWDSVAVYVGCAILDLKPDLERFVFGPALLEGHAPQRFAAPLNKNAMQVVECMVLMILKLRKEFWRSKNDET